MSNDMNRWAVAIRDSGRPAYLAIADVIAEDIQSGRLSANQRLPTLRKLAKALKRNFATVARGYAEAQRRGLIDSRAGSGTYVREMGRSALVSRAIAACCSAFATGSSAWRGTAIRTHCSDIKSLAVHRKIERRACGGCRG